MICPMPVVLIDGEIACTPRVEVDLASPLWLAGQSLFETMRVYPYGDTGLFRLDDHLGRLTAAARRVEWPYCPPKERLAEWARRAARLFRERHEGTGRLRLTVAWTRREGPPHGTVVVVPYTPVQSPASVVVTSVMAPQTGEETAKVGSRFLYSAAEAKARSAGADEALLVDAGGRPVEGAKSNLFVATDDAIVTPPVEAGPLAGVARRTVLEIARNEGIPVRQRPIEREELETGAPFLTNALWEVRPIRLVDGRAPKGSKEIVALLREAFRREVRRSLGT